MVDGQEPTNQEVAPESTPPAPQEGQKAIAQEASKPGTVISAAKEAAGELTAKAVDLVADAHLYSENGIPFWANAMQKLRPSNAQPDLGLLEMDETTGLPPQKLPEDKKPGTEIKDKEGRTLETVQSLSFDQEPHGGVSVTTLDRREDGTVASITTYTYDADGNIYSSGTIYMNGDAQTERTETTTYKTDEQGHLVGSTTTICDANNNPIGQNATTYEYDSEGNLIGETTMEMAPDGTPLGSEKNTFDYDEQGNLVGVTHEERDPNGKPTHVDRTQYDKSGEVVGYASTEYEGDQMFTTSFSRADDGSGDIVRTDIVAQNPPPEGGTGITQRSTTTMSADGSTEQVVETLDPKTGTVQATQTSEIKPDGSVHVLVSLGNGQPPSEVTYPPGTVQQFSESGTVQDGTRNLFTFGDGSIAQGLTNTVNLGLSAEITPENKNMTALQRGIARLQGWAETSTNPEASIDSVLAAIGEFGRDGSDPDAKRANATEGVRLINEIGKDASRSKTGITTADGTFTFAGDGSVIAGTHNIQHGVGDGDTKKAIDRSRKDGEDGTVQGGLKQYARYAPTFAESVQTILSADPAHTFGAARLAIASLADANSGRRSRFAGGTDNIERADDTPNDRDLGSGMRNLLTFGNGSLYRASYYLRGCSDDGRVQTGIANVRYASDDGSFYLGQKNMIEAGRGDAIKGFQNFKLVSDDGKNFHNGVDNVRSATDDYKISTGIVNLQRLSLYGDMVDGGRIVKLLGDGKFTAGVEIMRQLSDSRRFDAGSEMLKVLGGGSYERGAVNLATIGGGDTKSGVEYLRTVGGGSAESGIRTFQTIGGGDANKGVRLAWEAGGGVTAGKDAVKLGMQRLEVWGGGSVEAGAKYYMEHRAELLTAMKTAQFTSSIAAIGSVDSLTTTQTQKVADAIRLHWPVIVSAGASDGASAGGPVRLAAAGDWLNGNRQAHSVPSEMISVRSERSDRTNAHYAVDVSPSNNGAKSDRSVTASPGNPISAVKFFEHPIAPVFSRAQQSFSDSSPHPNRDVHSVHPVLPAHSAHPFFSPAPVSLAMKSADRAAIIEKAKQTFQTIASESRSPEMQRILARLASISTTSSTSAERTHVSLFGSVSMNFAQPRRAVFGGESIPGATTARSTFTYRASGGNDVTVMVMPDGRVMTLTRTARGVRSGFVADAQAVAENIVVTRRLSLKGTEAGIAEIQKQFTIKRARLIKRRLIGVEIALAVLLTSSAIARHLETRETVAPNEPQRARQSFPVLTRPTWLVRKNEDLVKLANHLFHDSELGWLIADLNESHLTELWVEDKRVVELKERQRIELPVWQDIVAFHKHSPRGSLNPDNLITIVTENHFDTQLINSTLAPAMGLKPVSTPASAALARVALR